MGRDQRDPESELVQASLADAELLAPGLIHEMRHPLMGIKAASQLLERQLDEERRTSSEWEMLVAQVARLEELFNSYQSLLSPERAAACSYSALEVVERAATLVRYRLKRLEDRFRIEAEKELPAAYGTPNALLHAVTNLLLNAVDAVEETGRAGRVEVWVGRHPEAPRRIRISVRDDGAGVAAADRDQIFTPRFTTKRSDKGTGLGLHIARRMMATFGGDVRLADDTDPAPSWVVTEFVIDSAAPPEGAPL